MRDRISLFVALLLTVTGACGGQKTSTHPIGPDDPNPNTMVTGKPMDPADIGAGWVDSPPLPPLLDNAAVYDPADYGPADVSVSVQDAQAFAAVQANTMDATAPILFAASDYAGGSVSATIELRGSTSRTAIQKSYQIKLAVDAGPWRGTRVINLLKHPFDLTRVRNGLSFEYFRHIAGSTSLRTGFIHLTIDSTDMGLYEWVEEPDENFLAAHGLNPSGTLYKAKQFSFDPIDNATAADATKVADIVASKGTPDLAKLRRMIAAVNDVKQPINDVLAHYFNRENYVTWLAINMLTADFDSGSQNFILYSPPGYEGWYFLPWDYDGAWGWNDQPGEPQRPRWRQGISNWWWVILHQRFLSEPDNVAEQSARIVDLATNTITDAGSATIMARSHDLIASFISMEPDLDNLPCDKGGTPDAIPEWEAEYTRIASNGTRAYGEYEATLNRPMPFWLYAPAFNAPGSVTLSWSPSHQLQGGAVTYDVEVNATETFDPPSVITMAAGLTDPLFTTTALPSGHLFWRVVARDTVDPANDWQGALNDHLAVDVP
jgi:spore coat protein H